MGYFNTISACYYSFNQSLLLQAEIVVRGNNKCIDICGFEELKQATLPQVARILDSAGYKIIINPHTPLKSELDVDYRVSEVNLDLENTQQYDDLLASLNHENKLLNTCGITYEKQWKKNSLYLLLQGSIGEMKLSFLEGFGNRNYKRNLMSFMDSVLED